MYAKKEKTVFQAAIIISLPKNYFAAKIAFLPGWTKAELPRLCNLPFHIDALYS
jgi:hypothetical protein